MRKVFWFIWCILLLICAGHYFYIIFTYNDFPVINIEHKFYLCLFYLSALSMLNLQHGKIFLFLLGFMWLSHIYLLPEYEEITALESCQEGKCEQALKMGIVKINKDNWTYISRQDRH